MLRFSCEKALLQGAVNTASRAVAAKSSIPALEGILLEGGDTLTLSGYNMQTGIRTGVDVFKALALGADGVLICRPFVTAVYGGGAEGVKCYIDKLAGELADTMSMCGAHSLAEITRNMVRV